VCIDAHLDSLIFSFFILFFFLQFYSKPQRSILRAKQCFQPQNKFWSPVFQEDVASGEQAKQFTQTAFGKYGKKGVRGKKNKSVY